MGKRQRRQAFDSEDDDDEEPYVPEEEGAEGEQPEDEADGEKEMADEDHVGEDETPPAALSADERQVREWFATRLKQIESKVSAIPSMPSILELKRQTEETLKLSALEHLGKFYLFNSQGVDENKDSIWRHDWSLSVFGVPVLKYRGLLVSSKITPSGSFPESYLPLYDLSMLFSQARQCLDLQRKTNGAAPILGQVCWPNTELEDALRRPSKLLLDMSDCGYAVRKDFNYWIASRDQFGLASVPRCHAGVLVLEDVLYSCLKYLQKKFSFVFATLLGQFSRRNDGSFFVQGPELRVFPNQPTPLVEANSNTGTLSSRSGDSCPVSSSLPSNGSGQLSSDGGSGKCVLDYPPKKGRGFSLKRGDPGYEESLRRKFLRLKKVLSVLFKQVTRKEGCSEKEFSVILRFVDGIDGSVVEEAFDHEGNALEVEKVSEKALPMIHYHRKLVLQLSKKRYNFLVKEENYTPIQKIYSFIKDFLNTNKDSFRIVQGAENHVWKNKDGEKKSIEKSRHAGLFVVVENCLNCFVRRHPKVVIDVLRETRKVLEFLTQQNLFDGKTGDCTSPIYKDGRRFSCVLKENVWRVNAVVGLGIHHDGAQNWYREVKKLQGSTDRKNFELFSMNMFDDPYSRLLTKFMIFMLLFLDLSQEKFERFLGEKKPFSQIFRELEDERMTISFSVPNELISLLEPTSREGQLMIVDLSFWSQLSIDMKAMGFHVDKINGNEKKSKSGRVNIASNDKLRPFLKSSSPFSKIKQLEKVSEDYILPLDEFFLSSYNLMLLFENPSRRDLRIPYAFFQAGEGLDPISQKVTDPLHATISLERFFLLFLEKFLKKLSHLGVLSKEAVRSFFKSLILKKIMSFESIFGKMDPFETSFDFSKAYKIAKNHTTVKASAYKKLFDEQWFPSMLEDVFKNRGKTFTDKDEIFLHLSQLLLGEVVVNLKSFCSLLDSEELFDRRRLVEANRDFDLFQIWYSAAVQVTKTHSDYVLDFTCTLAVDSFFRRVMGRNSMSSPESLNKSARMVINSTTSIISDFGKRGDAFEVFGENTGKTTKLDKFSSLACQVLLPLIAKTGDFLFCQEEVETTMKKGNGRLRTPGKVELIRDPVDLKKLHPGIFGDLLRRHTIVMRWVKEFRELLLRHERKVTFDNYLSFDSIVGTLKDYQLTTLKDLIILYQNRKSCLLSFNPGLGKTLLMVTMMSLVSTEREKPDYSLWIVPASILLNSDAELKKWDPILNTFHKLVRIQTIEKFQKKILQGDIRASRIVLVSANILKSVVDMFENGGEKERNEMMLKFFDRIRYVVCDESHCFTQGSICFPFPTKQSMLTNVRTTVQGGASVLEKEKKKAEEPDKEAAEEEDANVKEKDNIPICEALLKVKVLSGDSPFMFVTGTPFRNTTAFSNTLMLMTGENMNHLKTKFDKLFSSSHSLNLNEKMKLMKELEEDLKPRIIGRVFLQTPELKVRDISDDGVQSAERRVNLFFSVLELELDATQKTLMPTSVSVRNKHSIDRISLGSSFFSATDWKKEKKKEKAFPSSNLEMQSGNKAVLLMKMLEKIHERKIDLESYRRDYGLGPSEDGFSDEDLLLEKEEIPSRYWEKVIVISSSPTLLQQFRRFVVENSKTLREEHFVEINGTQGLKKRDTLRQSFEDSRFRVALISSKTGAVGLNYTYARYLILLEPDYDHTWIFQAIFRVFRIGQRRDCHCFLMTTKSEMSEDAESKKRARQTKGASQRAIFETALMKDLFSRRVLSTLKNIDELNVAETHFLTQFVRSCGVMPQSYASILQAKNASLEMSIE